jgi:aminoglycoside phosphotransferase (APT) family kinase protein
MNVIDALSEHATLDGINGMLLAGGEPHSALRRQLGALLSDPRALEQCHVTHARFRPGHKLRANFDAHLRAEGAAKPAVRAMEATWRAPRERSKDAFKDAPDFGNMQEEAMRRGVAAPFRQLVADIPALGVHIQISPLDLRFPQLVRLSDPNYVHDMLARVYSTVDAQRRQALASDYAVQCIRYRPGRRHVLRYNPIGGPEHGTVFAKVYAGENGERAFHVATALAAWLGQYGQGVSALQPLAFLAEDAVILYSRLLGESLSQYLQSRRYDAQQKLNAVGAALRVVHDLPPKITAPLKLHDLRAEVKQIKRSSEHLPTLLPSASSVVEALVARATELDESLPREQPTFTHGDFISEHIWVTPGGLVFIDFDNCFLADPALDIGKFLADLQLLYASHDLSGVEQAQEAFLSAYSPGVPAERLIRARLYEAIKLAKMAARRVYVFERDWASRTKRLIDRAEALMSGLEHALGLPSQPISL